MCVLTILGLSSWTAVPLDDSLCLRRLKRCVLIVENSWNLDREAVRKGHHVQFTVKILPVKDDRKAVLDSMGALSKLQWSGRRF